MEETLDIINELLIQAIGMPRDATVDVTRYEFRLLYEHGGQLTRRNQPLDNYRMHTLEYEDCRFRTLTEDIIDFNMWRQ
ncbi:MAG: hypothetical protein RL557_300 [archaeon]|jgi:hypothetical protein